MDDRDRPPLPPPSALQPFPENREYFDAFLRRGWRPNWDLHPAEAPLEMVLIETRADPNMRYVLENMSCLVPNAALTIMHSPDNADAVRAIVKAGGENHVRLLPVLPRALTKETYSELMTTPPLWELMRAPKVLLFQLDSGMRHNNVLRFMEYDYVGAPWPWSVYPDEPDICVGNGGFSLRSLRRSRQIARAFNFHPSDQAEDVFFARRMYHMDAAALPTRDEAAAFSLEYVRHPNPMAFHQAYGIYHPDYIRPLLTDAVTGIDATRPTTASGAHVQVTDAWIETEAGRVYNDASLVPWLRLGVGPNGLRLTRGTKLACVISDPQPGAAKVLQIAYRKDDQNGLATVPLSRNRVLSDLLI